MASPSPAMVVLLENLRFEPGETENDPGFAHQPRRWCDVVRQRRVRGVAPRPRVDRRPAAGAARRRRAAPAPRGRGASGRCSTAPARPFVAVLGGAKVSDKLGVIDALLDRCDTVLVGGAMAFTFLARPGARESATRWSSPTWSTSAARLLETGRVEIPTDVVIAAGTVADGADPRRCAADAIPDGWKGLDIGPATAERTPRARRARRPCSGTGRWACSRSRRSPRAPDASPERSPSPRVHRRRRRRQRRGDPPVRARRPGRPREHRRWRVARAHRAGRPARAGSTAPSLTADLTEPRPEELDARSPQADHRGQLEDAPRPSRRDPGGAEARVPARDGGLRGRATSWSARRSPTCARCRPSSRPTS